jgi:hypothetical protein
MPIKCKVRAKGIRGVRKGITSGSGRLLISTDTDIYRHGLVDVIVGFDSDQFTQIAQSMMDANPNEAIKAFGAAMQNGIPQSGKSN